MCEFNPSTETATRQKSGEAESRRMEKNPEFEEYLEQEAKQRYGEKTRQFIQMCHNDAHSGDYREPISQYCRRNGVEPSELSRAEKADIVFKHVVEAAEEYGLSEEIEDRYRYAENAHELLREAQAELKRAGRSSLASQVEPIVESLFMDEAR